MSLLSSLSNAFGTNKQKELSTLKLSVSLAAKHIARTLLNIQNNTNYINKIGEVLVEYQYTPGHTIKGDWFDTNIDKSEIVKLTDQKQNTYCLRYVNSGLQSTHPISPKYEYERELQSVLIQGKTINLSSLQVDDAIFTLKKLSELLTIIDKNIETPTTNSISSSQLRDLL